MGTPKNLQENEFVSAPLNLKDIRTLLEMLEKHDVREFKFERGDERVWLKRGIPGYEQTTVHVPHYMPTQMGHSMAAAMSASAPGGASNVDQESRPAGGTEVHANGAAHPPAATPEAPSKKLKDIKSPMVGTFYRRPAVDAEPYVAVGDMVKKGDVLCIVEAMKLMNEIEADMGGKIAEVCLDDGQMVEYGEVLFRVEVA